ncbi:aspartyl-phosphate phosphatase Spo0E family protein [Halobacillus fulvus]|nr:aspartyl-phosphate phosphatase Spo0E family protein [Halobacillus fulvus]
MHREMSLIQEIEDCREKMVQVATTHSLTSPIVVKASEELDQLMNEFEQLNNAE